MGERERSGRKSREKGLHDEAGIGNRAVAGCEISREAKKRD